MAKRIVLVPGFSGFDALGSLRYYAGVSEQFRRSSSKADGSIDYFDSFPTASVAQRAERLRKFLAKKWLRGDFQPGDELTLIGHSTGGLDIRRLLRDLRFGPYETGGPEKGSPVDTHVDGCTVPVQASELRGLIRRLVFLSVPHFGTNIADFFSKLEDLIRAGAAAAGDGIRVNEALSGFVLKRLPEIVGTTQCDLFTAIADTLRETDDSAPALKLADEREARYQLLLWLDHMSQDVSALCDLRSYYASQSPGLQSPAFYGPQARADELMEFANPPDLQGKPMPPIEVMSFATRAPTPTRKGLLTQVEHRATMAVAHITDFLGLQVRLVGGAVPGSSLLRNGAGAAIALGALARFGKDPWGLFQALHSICADKGLPFARPNGLAPSGVQPLLGDAPFVTATDIDVADNDGIANTLSMLWPYDAQNPQRYPHHLVNADHADIIGHHSLIGEKSPSPTGRQYASYDIFESNSKFSAAEFQAIWSLIFKFAL